MEEGRGGGCLLDGEQTMEAGFFLRWSEVVSPSHLSASSTTSHSINPSHVSVCVGVVGVTDRSQEFGVCCFCVLVCDSLIEVFNSRGLWNVDDMASHTHT